MPLIDKIREQKLIELAKTRFDPDLKPAELKVLHDSASPLFPHLAGKEVPRPKIRSDFVRWLATDHEAALYIDPRGLRIWGMTLPDNLDLAECRIFPTLNLRRCTFEGEINLKSTDTRGIYIFLSDLCKGLRGDRIIARSDFFLRRATCRGALRLVGAQIGGNLDCSGTKLTARGDALWLDGAEINGDVFLYEGFESSCEIRLLGVQIKGDLDCSNAKLKVTEGGALSADRAEIGGDVYLCEGFESYGDISLLGAKIKGGLNCVGAKLKVTEGSALSADGAEIGGDVSLCEGFESYGEISLLGAKIKGGLNCAGAKLKVTEGSALSADGAEIGGDVSLCESFESSGEIRLLGAKITGQLNCTGANLKAEGNALIADGAEVGGDVFLCEGFSSSGEIHLPGTRINGDLDCTGAKLNVAEGYALFADGAEISGDVFLCESFTSSGTIFLCSAQIGGQLDFYGAKVADVNCTYLRLSGDLFWMGIRKSEKTSLNLMGANVKNLSEDWESWPEAGKLVLDGLVYAEVTLHERPTDDEIKKDKLTKELELNVEERVGWLMRQPEDSCAEPQPWMLLSKHLEYRGNRKGAKHVIFKYHCLQAQKSWIPWRWLKIAFAWLEENPFRIGYSIVLTQLIGTSIFTWGGSKQAMIETVRYQPNAITDNGQVKLVSPLYPKYQPFVYTLENAVPLIKLGMDEKWTPNPSLEFRQPWFPRLHFLYFLSTYGWLNFWRWALIVGGWVQATVLAASVADRFRK